MKKCSLLLIVALVAGLTWSCIGGSVSQTQVKRYMLDYPSPRMEDLAPLDTVIKVERFTASPPYDQKLIVYREHSYERNVYHYERWWVSPPDMLADFIARDFRSQKLYRGVLRYDSPGQARFRIEGDLIGFLEEDAPEAWYAVLTVDVVLADRKSKDSSTWVVWQKNYHVREKCDGEGPKKLVEAMSRAVANFSAQLSRDVYWGVKERIAMPLPSGAREYHKATSLKSRCCYMESDGRLAAEQIIRQQILPKSAGNVP